jgi:general secretion pathway protein B
MSYILDALRKSEQERQIASGHGVGMLYPAMIEPTANNKWRLVLLGAGIIAATLATIWWGVSRNPPATVPGAGDQAAITGTSVNQPEIARPPLPATNPPGEARPATTRTVAERKTTNNLPATPGKPLAETQPKKAVAPPPVAQAAPPAMPGNRNESQGDSSPKGLPTINISGYINDEQGANLAIINDRLVREGEEIAPGLRLEKIIGENAVFNYKGQRFRR